MTTSIPSIILSVSELPRVNSAPEKHYLVAFIAGNCRLRITLDNYYVPDSLENLGRFIPRFMALSLIDLAISNKFGDLVVTENGPEYKDVGLLNELRMSMIHKIVEHTLLPDSTLAE